LLVFTKIDICQTGHLKLLRQVQPDGSIRTTQDVPLWVELIVQRLKKIYHLGITNQNYTPYFFHPFRMTRTKYKKGTSHVRSFVRQIFGLR
jgi:hypothetical protein